MGVAKNTGKYYLVLALSLLLMIVVGFIPPFGDMTPYGMKLLAIFVGCIFGWLFGIVIPVSLLAIVMTGLIVSGQTVDAVMTSVQSANMLLVVFWAFIFIYGLKKCGLLEYITKKIMSIKICRKSPWHLAVTLWLCTMICAGIAATSPTACAILMFSIYANIAGKLGIRKASAYTSFVLVMIAAVAALSIKMVPYSSGIFFSLSFMSAVVPDASYNIMIICLVNFCTVLGFIIIGAILFKILLKTNLIKAEFDMSDMNKIFEKDAVLNTKIKWGFFYIVFLVAVMILPMILPEGNFVKVFLDRIGSIGMFVIVVTMMCLTTVNGEKLLDLEKAFKDGAINWSVYFMMGTALAVSTLLVSDEAGLSLTLQNLMGDAVEGMSIYVLCLVFLIFGLALTNCITNAVAMQLVIPVVSIFMVAKGVNPYIIAGIAGNLLNWGLIFPSGSPLGAFIHGYVEWIEPKQCYLYTIVLAVCVILSIAAIALPLALVLSPVM